MYTLIYKNVNEEGFVYATHFNLEDAVKLLEKFPNDTIVISMVVTDV